jgi:hypothetical protein
MTCKGRNKVQRKHVRHKMQTQKRKEEEEISTAKNKAEGKYPDSNGTVQKTERRKRIVKKGKSNKILPAKRPRRKGKDTEMRKERLEKKRNQKKEI